jgi:Holliday junction resolvase RusA-like endonuclease
MEVGNERSQAVRIRFTILGDPQALKRHRMVARGRGGRPLPFVRSYDPSATAKQDFLLKVQQHAPAHPLACPVRLECYFTFARPKGHYRTGKHAGELRESAPVLHTTKPDLDNLVKFVKDALTGVFWIDDSVVCDLKASKVYASFESGPQTQLTISWDDGARGL